MSNRISCLLILIVALSVVLLNHLGCARKQSVEVIVYVSEDQVFSEPILKDFERETGIKVKAVYDTEEAKSTGVMNRLIAEKDNPQADVYWANEPIRAEVLKQMGLSAAYFSPSSEGISNLFKDIDGYWTGFSARARVLMVHHKATDRPLSFLDFSDPKWKGKTVLANPLFGTTTVQIAALMTLWGDDRVKQVLSEIKLNQVKISTSNGESADFVGAGTFDFSLVDSDDVVNRMRLGQPVEMIFPDQGEGQPGCLIIPNAVLLINNARHIQAGKKLIDYLLSRETEKKLAFANCAQIPLHTGVETPSDVPKIQDLKVMNIHYSDVAKKLEEIQDYLKDWAGY